MADVNIQTVEFAGYEIECIVQDDQVYVSVSRLSDTLTLDPSSQLKTLKSKKWAESTLVYFTGVGRDDRQREMAMLPLKCVPMWMSGISLNAIVDDEIKNFILKLQLEAVDALSDHFLGTNYTKKKSEEIAPALDIYDFLLKSAQAMSDMNKRQLEVESKVDSVAVKQAELETNIDRKIEKIEEDLEGKGIVPVETMRSRINRNVRSVSDGTNKGYSKAWGDLYTQYLARYRVNLRTRANNDGVKPLDWAEKYGHLQNLYNLSVEMYGDADIKVED